MFIPLTKNEKLWQTNERLLFIDDIHWISKNPEILQRYSYEVFDADYCELGVDEDEMWAFAIELADASHEILNEYHKLAFSKRYWRRVLFLWMQSFVPAVCLRYFRLLAVHERYAHEAIETATIDEEQWADILLNMEELITLDGDRADIYGWWLYSLIIKYGEFNMCQRLVVPADDCVARNNEVAPERLNGVSMPKRALRILMNQPYKFLKMCGLYAINKLIPYNDPNRVEVVLTGFGSKETAVKLKLNSRGRISWFPQERPEWVPHVRQHPSIQWEFRRKAGERLQKSVQPTKQWKKVLTDIFFREMPCSYIENFNRCRSVYRSQYENFPRLRYIISSSGALFTERAMAMNEQEERGVQFSLIAHGSARPSRAFKVLFGKILSDVHYVWGNWGEDIGKKIINYRETPAEKLYIYDKLIAEPTSNILYVGDWVSPVLQKIDYHTIGRILQRETSFLAALEEDVQKDMVIRNYPVPVAAALDRWLRYAFPNVRISREHDGVAFKNETFAQALLNSRMCIVDHYETPFLEALYINKPFILYFDEAFLKRYFDPETEQPYVDMMREVGLIQYGPEAAANYLNEIYSHIEEWWREPRRQEVVNILRERYTGTYIDPERWWRKEIIGLLKGDVKW